MYTQGLRLLSLSLFSSPAWAFPVMAAQWGSQIGMFILIALFASQANPNKIWRRTSLLLALTLTALFTVHLYWESVRHMAQENVYHESKWVNPNTDAGFQVVSPQDLANKDTHNQAVVVLVDRPIRPISGQTIFHHQDIDKIVSHLKQQGRSDVVLIHHDLRVANAVAHTIQPFLAEEMKLSIAIAFNDARQLSHLENEMNSISVEIYDPDPPASWSMLPNPRVSERYEPFNHVFVGYPDTVTSDLPSGARFIPSLALPYLPSEDWETMAQEMDPDKELIVTHLDPWVLYRSGQLNPTERSEKVAQFVAKKLGKSSTSLVTKRIYSSESGTINRDNFLTPWFIQFDRYLSPSYIYQSIESNRLGILCFTEACVQQFPSKSAINIIKENWISYSGGLLDFDFEKIDDWRGQRTLALAPDDAQTLQHATLMAFALSEKYDSEIVEWSRVTPTTLEGFLYHPTNYYSGSFYDNETLVIDSILQRAAYNLEEAKSAISWPQWYVKPWTWTILTLFVIMFSILLWPSKWWLSAFFTLLLTPGVVLVWIHPMSSAFTLPIWLLVLSVNGYGKLRDWSTPSNLITTVIVACIGLFVSSDVRSVMFIILCASAFALALDKARQVHLLSKPILTIPNMLYLGLSLGRKAQMTHSWMPLRYRGLIVRGDALNKSLRKAKYYNDAVILRSNHIHPNEHQRCGEFESITIPKGNDIWPYIDAAYLNAKAQDLHDSQIQFWLQPLIETHNANDGYGVIHSLCPGDESQIVMEIHPEREAITNAQEHSKMQQIKFPRHQEQVCDKQWQSIIGLLKRLEKAHKLPIRLEFVCTKGHWIPLQVCPLNHPMSDTQARRQALIEPSLLTTHQRVYPYAIGHGTQDALFQLTSGGVIGCETSAFIATSFWAKQRDKAPLTPQLVEHTYHSLMQLHRSCITQLHHSSVCRDLATLLSPLMGHYFHHTSKASLSDETVEVLMPLMVTIWRERLIYGLVLRRDYDIDSGCFPINPDPPASPQLPAQLSMSDVCHALLSLGLAILARTPRPQSQPSPNLEGYSVRQILVDGDFTGEKVSLEEFLTKTESEQRVCTIVDHCIATPFVGQALKAQAWCLSETVLLSHAIQTAIAQSHPLMLLDPDNTQTHKGTS
ncbi:hypothetical protein AB6D11_06415 [Vibrio splendidus]